MKKLLAAIGITLAFGGAPVIPEDMEFKLAYTASCENAGMMILNERNQWVEPPFVPPPCVGEYSVAAFEDHKGNVVYYQMDREQYHRMTLKGGYAHNPTKQEFLAVWELLVPKAEAAISREDASHGFGSGTSLTIAHDGGSASDRFIAAFGQCLGTVNDQPTGITFNGDSLTLQNTINMGANNAYLTLGTLFNSDTSSNNLTLTCNASSLGNAVGAVTYSSVHQSALDATVQSVGPNSTTTLYNTLTTNTAGAFHIAAFREDSGASMTTTNCTHRAGAADIGIGLVDSDAIASPGAHTCNGSWTGASNAASIGVAIAPFTASAGATFAPWQFYDF